MLPVILPGYTMANELPSTLRHLIPSYLEREVSRLLNSRGQFLTGRKRSSAASTALKELYSQLEDWWEELTWQQKTPAIKSMRSEASTLLKLNKRSDESVTSDLELQYESEWRRTESNLQSLQERLEKKRMTYADALKRYQQRKTYWDRKLKLEKGGLAEYYHTLKSEQSELAKQYSADVADLESKLRLVKELSTAYESRNIPASEVSWTERRTSLTKRRSDLMQRKQSLQQKRQAWNERKKRLDELTDAEYQTSQTLSERSSHLKAITKKCRTLKAQLVQQGKLTAEDFPDVPMPLV